MIWDFFLNIASSFLGWIATALNFPATFFSYAFPTQITSAFSYFFSAANRWNNIFPISDFFAAITFILLVWVLVYTVKLMLWIFKHIPWIGAGASGDLVSHTTSYSHSTDDGGRVTQTISKRKLPFMK